MLLQPLAHAVDGDLQNVGVGQAALHVAVFALPVDEREVFGMLLVELTRDEHIEAVHERIVNRRPAAVPFREPIMVPVQSVPRREVGVTHHLGPVHFAILERGNLCFVQLRQVDARELRHDFKLRRDPPDAEFLLQQRVNAVEGPPRSATGNDDFFAIGPQRETVRAEFVEVDAQFQPLQMRVVTEQNLARLHRYSIAHNRQPRAVHAFEVTLQLLGGVAFGRDCVGSDDDAVSARALLSDGSSAGHGRVRNKRHCQRNEQRFPMPMSPFGIRRSEKSIHNRKAYRPTTTRRTQNLKRPRPFRNYRRALFPNSNRRLFRTTSTVLPSWPTTPTVRGMPPKSANATSTMTVPSEMNRFCRITRRARLLS